MDVNMKVFISYASQDANVAEKICDYLEKNNKSCWIAPRNISVGKEYGEEIIKGIEQSDVLVLVFSAKSNKSQHVLREVERAVGKNIPLISYNIDNSTLSKSMEYFLLSTQRLDATKHSTATMQLLNESIDKLLQDEEIPNEEIVLPTITNKRQWFKRNKIVVILGATATCVFVIGIILFGNGILSANKQDKDITEVSSAADITGTDVANNTLDINQTKTVSENLPISNNQPTSSAVDETNNTDTGSTTSDANEEDNNDVSQSSMDGKNGESGNASDIENTDSNSTTDTKQTGTETTDSQQEETISVFEEGNYLMFGRYYPAGYSKENNDGEINWVITDIDSKSGELTLVSEYILDIIPYDTAESGIFDKDMSGNSYDRDIRDTYSFEQMTEFRGNSDWELSNIRTWLNSKQANVKYTGSAPVNRGSDEFSNGYNTKAGFLHNFTDFELAMIQKTEIKTPVNALEQDADTTGFIQENGKLSDSFSGKDISYKTTEDKVFLLSLEEVQKYADKGIFQPFTKPTASAAASDDSPWLKTFEANGSTNYIWATRTPLSNSSHMVVTIGTGNSTYEFNTYWAAISGHGIRPAIVIKPEDFTLTGEGSSNNPYVISGK